MNEPIRPRTTEDDRQDTREEMLADIDRLNHLRIKRSKLLEDINYLHNEIHQLELKLALPL